ncbi:hypothetical protein Slala03_76500 [Streptomyces lavendulae subsp. lavendulae]|uniref:DoxX family protein n=1 Tax=Streptomyces lavendulae TaxID=1914 RepID=UPI00249F9B19|nr:DoxX family protein [Streptomyces lavendulae]GLV87961.1 hypothetical protein Slala03_76500 [Streptomyces lavendulae subsp. lavendulae]
MDFFDARRLHGLGDRQCSSAALFCFYAGTLKAVRNRDRLRPMTAWVDRVPLPAFRALETVEVLGTTGLISLPLTGIVRGARLEAVAKNATGVPVRAMGVSARARRLAGVPRGTPRLCCPWRPWT